MFVAESDVTTSSVAGDSPVRLNDWLDSFNIKAQLRRLKLNNVYVIFYNWDQFIRTNRCITW